MSELIKEIEHIKSLVKHCQVQHPGVSGDLAHVYAKLDQLVLTQAVSQPSLAHRGTGDGRRVGGSFLG